jgi:hypothetical protein
MTSSAADRPHRTGRHFNPDRDVEEWHGKYYPYDLVKEFLIALVVVVLGGGALAVVLLSGREAGDRQVVVDLQSRRLRPDRHHRARRHQRDVATYGPPYNSTPGASQSIGPFSPEQLAGRPPSDRHSQ